MSSTQKILIQFFINAVVAQLCLSACNPMMLFRETVNAQPIVDIYKKWQGKDTPGCPCVYVICREIPNCAKICGTGGIRAWHQAGIDNADIYLLNGYRTGGCAAAHPELKPTCQKAGQQLSCVECEGAGCMPRVLKLQDAPTTPKPEWMELISETCKKYSAESCPCGWAKCVSYPGWRGSGCCLPGYKYECCSYVLLPPEPIEVPPKRIIPPPEPVETTTETETETPTIRKTKKPTEEPNTATAVTLLTSKMCIALTSFAITLRFANNQLQL